MDPLFDLSTKRCSTCHNEKPISEFHANPGRRDGRNGKCKECVKAYNDKLWQENPERMREKMRESHRKNRAKQYAKAAEYRRNNREAIRQSARERVARFKNGLRCQVCGEGHPACITFHHRDPMQKEFNIARAMAAGKSDEVILAEIAKCDVLCRNCHAKVHWDQEAGWQVGLSKRGRGIGEEEETYITYCEYK